MMYQLTWEELTRSGHRITRWKSFESDAARVRFTRKLAKKPSFLGVISTSDPEA